MQAKPQVEYTRLSLVLVLLHSTQVISVTRPFSTSQTPWARDLFITSDSNDMSGIFSGKCFHFKLSSPLDRRGRPWTRVAQVSSNTSQSPSQLIKQDAGANLCRDPEKATHVLVELANEDMEIPVPTFQLAAQRIKKHRELPDLISLFGRLVDDDPWRIPVIRFVRIGWLESCLEAGKLLPESEWEVR